MTTPHHFFLSSVATWMTTGPDRSLTDAIKAMESEKFTFFIWYVPAAYDAEYEISYFAPQVAGAHVVDEVHFRKGRRIPTPTAKETV